MSIFAKQALIAKHAYVAALLAGTTAVAGAQPYGSAPANPEGAQNTPHGMQGRGGNEGYEGRERHDSAKMQAHMAKRQAELKAMLNILPEQEGNWSSFTTALKPQAMSHDDMGKESSGHAEFDKLTTPERIDKMQGLREERQASMNQAMNLRGEATKAFYSTLNPEQKKVFDTEAFRSVSPRHRWD